MDHGSGQEDTGAEAQHDGDSQLTAPGLVGGEHLVQLPGDRSQNEGHDPEEEHARDLGLQRCHVGRLLLPAACEERRGIVRFDGELVT